MPKATFAPAIADAAREALSRLGEHRIDISVAGHHIAVRFAGEELGRMTRAFEHIRCAEETVPELDIIVWDTLCSGVSLPDDLGSANDHLRRGMAQLRNDAGVRSLFEVEGGLSVLDTGERAGYYWVPDASMLSERDRAAPLQTLLAWWLPSAGTPVVHAGVFGRGRKGVLLSGRSGAGKSTTALACVEAGYEYVGDDFCALSFEGDAVYAHSLFASAKVYDDHLHELPGFAAGVVNPHRPGPDDKAIAYLPAVQQMELRAAIALVGKTEGPPRIERVAGGRALLTFAPTTLFNLPGQGKSELDGLARLVRGVPCYEMVLSRELAANPRALDALLEGGE